MDITLLDIRIRNHSQSWIDILSVDIGNRIGSAWHLFLIEWNYDKKVERLTILGIRFI